MPPDYLENQEPITTFAELMDYIAYDWGYDRDNLIKTDEGFVINKTYITPTEVSYKGTIASITNPMVYSKLEQFYQLLQETELENLLFKEEQYEPL